MRTPFPATVVLGVVAALGLVPVAQAQVPATARQWEARNAASVRSGTDLQLFNQRNRSQLGHDNRVFGIDLGWTKRGGDFRFMVSAGNPNIRDHRVRSIAEYEQVAIYNTKVRRYLKYYKRGPTKAELEWSRTPVYEWQVRGQSGNAFALFNDRVDRYLVYQVKNYGINLGWLNLAPPSAQSYSVALSAQPPVQGWIPFLGSFGTNTRGVLLSVQNASQSATLLFVKPGRSSNECGNPDATVPLAPGATMTGQQRTTLYGAESPRLPVYFLACVTTATPQSVTLTFLNITYRLDQ